MTSLRAPSASRFAFTFLVPRAYSKTQHLAFGARCWRDPIAFLARESRRPFQAPTSVPLKRPEHSCLESLSATTAGAIYPSLLPGCGPRPRGGSNLTFRVLGSRASQSSGRTPEPTTTFLQNEAWHTLSDRGPKAPPATLRRPRAGGPTHTPARGSLLSNLPLDDPNVPQLSGVATHLPSFSGAGRKSRTDRPLRRLPARAATRRPFCGPVEPPSSRAALARS